MEVERRHTRPRKRRKVVDSSASTGDEQPAISYVGSVDGVSSFKNLISEQRQARPLNPDAKTLIDLQPSLPADPLPRGLRREAQSSEDDPQSSMKSKPLKASLGVHVKSELQDDKGHQVATNQHTYGEALATRQLARDIGVESFIEKLGRDSDTSLLSLCSIFGVARLDLREQDQRKQLLKKLRRAMEADMRNRIKLPRYSSFEDAITLVRNARNILVITGAGMSTSLDIPDFRSSGGLYSQLREIGFQEPENVFSRDTFEQDPKQFFSVASMILPSGDGRFTPAHAFLRLLQDKGKLLTIYTQNVDGIDLVAGIIEKNLIQLHGSFATATCITCGHQVLGETIFPDIRNNVIPKCEICHLERQGRIERSMAARATTGRSMRPRLARIDSQNSDEPVGILRPDIVFMGEPPRTYLARFERDCAKADLVLVVGSSLPVEPVKSMPNQIPAHVPQIYIGKDQMVSGRHRRPEFDIQLLGECDIVAELLAKECGWDLVHEMLPKNSSIDVQALSGLSHCHSIYRKPLVVKLEDDK